MATVKVDFIDKETGRRYAAGKPYDGNRVQELVANGFLNPEARTGSESREDSLPERKPRGRRKKASN